MRLFLISLAIGLSAVIASPAAAEIAASSERGFVSHNVVEVPASPAAAWAMLTRPSEWWNGEHSYSGSAANMTLEPVAGGCFCESIPAASGSPAGRSSTCAYSTSPPVQARCASPERSVRYRRKR